MLPVGLRQRWIGTLQTDTTLRIVTLSPLHTPVGVVGAGAMGTGIAQVALRAGHPVVLADARAEAVSRARATLTGAFDREVAKGRLTRDAADGAVARLTLNVPT